MRSVQPLGHAVVGHVPMGTPRHLVNHISVVLDPRTHMEEQPANSLVIQHIAPPAVLVKHSLALLVTELATNPVQNSHKRDKVQHTFALQVEELENMGRCPTLVLLYLGPLPHLLEDVDLQLLNPFETDPALEQPKSMHQIVNKELLPLQRHRRVEVLTKLVELFLTERLTISRPIPNAPLEVIPRPFSILHHTAHMRMPLNLNTANQLPHHYLPPFLKLTKHMVHSSPPLLTDIVPHIRHKLEVVHPAFMREVVPYYPQLLRCQENTRSVEQQVKGMLTETPPFLGVVFGDLSVEVQQVLVGPAEELELELVVDFRSSVDPVHCSYKYIADKVNKNRHKIRY